MAVPFFDYKAFGTADEAEILDLLRDVMRRGAFILQADVVQFERELATFVGTTHGIGVGNATDGLALALRAAGVGRGHEVILPSHTFVATAEAIVTVGATPVLVDCSPDHLINPASIASAITERTRALLPVHLNGRVCDMDAICELATKHDLVVVEDAAQALGARFNNRAAGTFGAAAAFSFYPAKSLGCFGDGGAVVTSRLDIAEAVSRWRDHARESDGEVTEWGCNSRLDNLHAAILSYRLSRFQSVIDRRRAIAADYNARLSSLSQLVLPPPPSEQGPNYDTFQNYEIEAEERAALARFLNERHIGTALPWSGKAIHQFSKLGFADELPFTERLFERVLLLPMNQFLTDRDVEAVCSAVVDFYR